MPKIILAAALFCAASVNANATLSLVDNGLGVYDSALNVTWTSDANLQGTLEANAIANGDAGAQNLIANIISASGGVIHDTASYIDNGTHTLSATDFITTGLNQGTATWWGTQAFVNYLNHINYGNSNQWALPTTVDNSSSYGYPPASSSQLAELFYNELGGTAVHGIPTNSLFSNVQAAAYWSGTEYSGFPFSAWTFLTNYGSQYNYGKNSQYHAWAVSPGQVNAVPVPGAVWLFCSGVLGLLGLKRRVHAR